MGDGPATGTGDLRSNRPPENTEEFTKAMELAARIKAIMAFQRAGVPRPKQPPLPEGREQGIRAGIRERFRFWGAAIVRGIPLLNKVAKVTLALVGGSILAGCLIWAKFPLPWAVAVALAATFALYLEGTYRVYVKSENERRATEREDIGLFELANMCEGVGASISNVRMQRDEEFFALSEQEKERVRPHFDGRTLEIYGEEYGGDLFWCVHELAEKNFVTREQSERMAWPRSLDELAEIGWKLEDFAERFRTQLRVRQGRRERAS